MTTLPRIGAPLRRLTPEQLEQEKAAYTASPRSYVISRRARELGVAPSTLWHHLCGGRLRKAGVLSWRQHVKLATASANRGDRETALKHFRLAADKLEEAGR